MSHHSIVSLGSRNVFVCHGAFKPKYHYRFSINLVARVRFTADHWQAWGATLEQPPAAAVDASGLLMKSGGRRRDVCGLGLEGFEPFTTL